MDRKYENDEQNDYDLVMIMMSKRATGGKVTKMLKKWDEIEKKGIFLVLRLMNIPWRTVGPENGRDNEKSIG